MSSGGSEVQFRGRVWEPGARVGYRFWGASRPEAARPSAAGARSEAPKAPRRVGCGEGVPLPTGSEVWGVGRAPPRKRFCISNEFWSFLGATFYSSSTHLMQKKSCTFTECLVHFIAFVYFLAGILIKLERAVEGTEIGLDDASINLKGSIWSIQKSC